jgi:cobyrinic acid a,c-diamide synthase
MGRSVAALVHGFRTFSTGGAAGAVRLAGVVLNRVSSARHEEILREALDEVGTPVLGALHRHEAVAAPSRHLGLVPVAERAAEAQAAVDVLADLISSSVDLEAVEAAARSAPPLPVTAWAPPATDPVPGRPVVAIAGGPAFTFSYAETPELLRAAGAEVVDFDPLRDTALPEGTRAVVVGGGFPEVYAAELSANTPLRAAMAAHAAAGRPIAAECAGLLWLCRSLDGAPMCKVLDADATMTGRLTLGYRDAVAVTDSWVGGVGTRVTGHEFHRTDVRPRTEKPQPAWRWRDAAPEGFVAGRVHASYLHLHWAGYPHIARQLVAESVLVEEPV